MSGVFRTIDPPPPLHSASVSSPRTKGGGWGTHSPGGDGGGGVNISEDARHWIGLLQYNPSTLLTVGRRALCRVLPLSRTPVNHVSPVTVTPVSHASPLSHWNEVTQHAVWLTKLAAKRCCKICWIRERKLDISMAMHIYWQAEAGLFHAKTRCQKCLALVAKRIDI